MPKLIDPFAVLRDVTQRFVWSPKSMTVTLTGADDGVPPAELLALAREFRFVEFGILLSASRKGVPRYPSAEWIKGLAEAYHASGESVAFAAHLCGRLARDAMAGCAFWSSLPPLFKRFQINQFSPENALWMKACLRTESEERIILQAKHEDMILDCAAFAMGKETTYQILVDGSGGNGIAPKDWPAHPSWLSTGYAGGITPENVRSVLDALVPKKPDWIDLESGLRDESGAFCLKRARLLLEEVAAWKQEMAAAGPLPSYIC